MLTITGTAPADTRCEICESATAVVVTFNGHCHNYECAECSRCARNA